MKILSASQTKKADQYTIENEPISSLKLMERAAKALRKQFIKDFQKQEVVSIFCGMGNNGGDGLALGRLLYQSGYRIKLYVVKHSDSGSDDFQENLSEARKLSIPVKFIKEDSEKSFIDENEIIVEAILGSGLSRPLEGFISEVVQWLNHLPNHKISVDIPTGLFADDNSENDLNLVFKADSTYTLQHPKLSLLHFKTLSLAGDLKVLDIGLHRDFLEEVQTENYFLQFSDFADLHQKREKHSYKGTYGHCLLVAGSRSSMGAAIMSGKAALRSGAGLLTAHVPSSGLASLNTALPEAMAIADENETIFSQYQPLQSATSTAVGPGLGTDKKTESALQKLIQDTEHPMVLDADALNLLSENADWYDNLPENTILTPHPGELKRLLDVDELAFDFMDDLKEFCRSKKVIVVLKYSVTVMVNPHGEAYFMDEGSPALASPGSGDVLTGIIGGLLASGYPAENAAMLAVYLQGKAARLASDEAPEACLATDVIEHLKPAWASLQNI